MMSRQIGRTFYALTLAVLAAALVASAVRAQSTNFQAKRTAIQRQAQADRTAAALGGDANRKKLYSLYPTPEIPLAKPVVMAPGSTAALSMTGTFSDKTTFVSRHDGVELQNPVVAANSFKATVSAAADLPPTWARIHAFAPVSGAEAWAPAVFVGAPATFSLAAANGWSITLAPQAKAFEFPKPGTATVTYKAEYFKPGSATPFETTTGSLTIEAENDPGSYSFMMSAGNSGSAQAETLALAERMAELMKAGKFDSPELAKIQKKMEAAQERWAKEMEAQIKDPAAAQKKQDEFGCDTINLTIRAGSVTGSVSCGKNVGSSLRLTGK
jgi:hypothetical protein